MPIVISNNCNCKDVSKFFEKDQILKNMFEKDLLRSCVELDPIVMSIYFMYKITEDPWFLQKLSVLEDLKNLGYLRYSEQNFGDVEGPMLLYQYIKYELGLLDSNSPAFKEIEKRLSFGGDSYK